MDAIATLDSALGAGRATRPDAPWTDVCRLDLGTPAAVVCPRSTDEVAAVVRAARALRLPLVPVGARTAYWRPLRVEGAIALDLAGLRGLTEADGAWRVGAGEPVRPLDVALRARGSWLPLHPDAFGETPVGAMVAMAATSGIGMGHGSISDHLTGLTVVTGAGEVLHTGGAAALRGVPPFLRDGFPDATGLFVGAEGTLGVITALDLRSRPTPWRVHLHGQLPSPLHAARAAAELGARGLFDTFRLVREVDRARGQAVDETPWTVDIWVDSLLDADDALARARRVAATLRDRAHLALTLTPESEDARRGASPAYDARWAGPMGAHAELAARARFVGLDVNAPWSTLDTLLPLADDVARAQHDHGALMVRTALYLTGELVNLGMHTTFPPDDATAAWALAHQQEGFARLAALPVLPYRLGRLWPAATQDRLDPAWRRWYAGVRRQLDPDGILQPGHPLALR